MSGKMSDHRQADMTASLLTSLVECEAWTLSHQSKAQQPEREDLSIKVTLNPTSEIKAVWSEDLMK